MYGAPFDPAAVAADIEAKRRAGRFIEARDLLHRTLPYAPNDPALCHAGGKLYAQLGYAHEAVRFLEVVEKSQHPSLAAHATQMLTKIAAEGTEGARDVAVCVLKLSEVWGAMMTPYARQWPYAHWEASTLADPCWVLNVTHLQGSVSGGHAIPPPHRLAWWTVRYAIEALEPGAITEALGGRFSEGDVLVFLETPTMGLPFEAPQESDRLGTVTLRPATALERVTPPVEVSRLTRVYVAGRVASGGGLL